MGTCAKVTMLNRAGESGWRAFEAESKLLMNYPLKVWNMFVDYVDHNMINPICADSLCSIYHFCQRWQSSR